MLTERRYLLVLGGVTAIIIFLALYTHLHRQGRTRAIDTPLIGLGGAIQKQLRYVGTGTRAVFEHYLILVNAKKRAEELEKEVGELRTKVTHLQELELENQRLTEQLQFTEKQTQKMLSARVVAHDVSPDFVGLRIDRGSSSDVGVGMGVISHGGVVGRIVRVTKNFSDVVTILDPTSTIDVIIQRSRARGILSGQAKQLMAKLKYVDRLEDIIRNDTVVSTDFEGIFPKGLLLGTVTDVIPSSSGILQTVIVKSAIDILKLEEVSVVFPRTQSKAAIN